MHIRNSAKFGSPTARTAFQTEIGRNLSSGKTSRRGVSSRASAATSRFANTVRLMPRISSARSSSYPQNMTRPQLGATCIFEKDRWHSSPMLGTTRKFLGSSLRHSIGIWQPFPASGVGQPEMRSSRKACHRSSNDSTSIFERRKPRRSDGSPETTVPCGKPTNCRRSSKLRCFSVRGAAVSGKYLARMCFVTNAIGAC